MKRRYTLWYIDHTELAEYSIFLRLISSILFSSKDYQTELALQYHFGALYKKPNSKTIPPLLQKILGRLTDLSILAGIIAIIYKIHTKRSVG